jgi:hypothetical protein
MNSPDLSLTDLVRIALNIALAIGQILASRSLFADGFETADGPLPTAGTSPVVPAGYAFAIWAPIYLGSLVYAAAQVWPGNAASPLFRETGWLTALAFAGCILWLLAAKYGPVIATLPLILLMLVSLLGAVALAANHPLNRTGAAYWVVLAPLCLYAGWLSVAVFANAAAVLPGYGFERFGLSMTAWAVLLLACAFVVAVIGLRLSAADPFYAGAVAWALIAIAVANVSATQRDLVIASVSIVAAIALALLTAVWRRGA